MWTRWVVLLIGVIASAGATAPAAAKPPRRSYLENALVKIGVDLDRGGSIGYLADTKKGGNVVNIHDLGRWIGPSYYAGPRPFGKPHPGWKDWPWNPVSAGDVYSNPSKVVETKNDGQTLYVKAVPGQWALENVPGECTLETWITLEGRSVQVRNRLTNLRKDQKQYPALDQELPAANTIGKLHRLLTYTGDRPYTGGRLTEIPRSPSAKGSPRWSTFFATEHWAALVDDDDWGLGVIHSGVVRFLAVSTARRTPVVPTTTRPATLRPFGRKSWTPTSSTNTATPLSSTRWRTSAKQPTSSAQRPACPTTASRATGSTGGS